MMDTQGQEQNLIIKPRQVLFVFGGAGIIVLILSYISQYLRLFPDSYNIHSPFQADLIHDFIAEFDFNGQPNIAIYYNVLTLNVAACLLFIIAYFKNILKDAYRFYWIAMAWMVLFFSIDNLAEIHEKINLYFQGTAAVGGWSEYTWVIAGVAGIVILAVLFRRFWLHLDTKYRFLFLASVILYFAGILGKEVTRLHASKDFIYSLYITFEQGLQYGGATLLIYSLLLYILFVFPRFFVSTKDLTDKSRNVQQDTN